MSVQCAELMDLPTFQRISLVGGRGGLDRVVRCPYVTLTHTIAQWVYGGEFMFVSGLDLNYDETRLCALLEESYKKKLAGVAILVTTEKISGRLIDMADQFCLPLFEMPYDLPLVEVTEEISSFIIQTRLQEAFISELMLMILDRNGIEKELLISRAAFYHYDLSGSHQIAIVDLQNIQVLFQEKETFLVEKAMKYMENLRSFIHMICKQHGWHILSMIVCGSVLLLLPNVERHNIEMMLSELKKYVIQKFDSSGIQIGVGRQYLDLKEMQQSKIEAERAVLLTKHTGAELAFYQDLGMYKILFEVSDKRVMKTYYNDVLGEIAKYDKESSMSLIKTLEMYLLENCNLVRTAERLYIHRNTLVYRIHKIQEITQYDFTLPEVRERCRQAILVGNFLKL